MTTADENGTRPAGRARTDRMTSVGGRHNPGSSLSVNNPTWMDDGLCKQVDDEIFFPEKGGAVKEAKKVCRSCPVIDQCLAYAVDRHERFGIWGGLTERDRRSIEKGSAA